MVYGIILALIEITFIFGGAFALRRSSSSMKQIKCIPYYWLILTIFTGFCWETAFVINYKNTTQYSHYLIEKNENVWTNSYSLKYLVPKEFSYIFYGTYGAWADREYMTNTDDWSRVIESSHAIFCGLFALLTLIFKINDQNNKEFLLCLGISMGSQLMNSILYMVEYFIQCHDSHNINYNNVSFPMGTMLSKRPFMWVNIFWTLLPLYTIIVYIIWIPSNETPSNNSNEIPPKYSRLETDSDSILESETTPILESETTPEIETETETETDL